MTVTTDDTGIVKERLRFDPWGKPMTALGSKARTGDRGFTGHEHLAGGLIHMNGRIYDPVLGRFLSADTVVQFPSAITSYNRYAYVMNNPLAFTDPSGYFIPLIIAWVVANAGALALASLAAAGIAAATGHMTAARRFLGAALMFTGMYMAVGATAAQAAWWTVGTAFAAGGIQSGSLEGAVLAGMSAGIGMGIGEIISLANAGAFAQVENVATATQAFGWTVDAQGALIANGSRLNLVQNGYPTDASGVGGMTELPPIPVERVDVIGKNTLYEQIAGRYERFVDWRTANPWFAQAVEIGMLLGTARGGGARSGAGMPSLRPLPKNPGDLLKQGYRETTHPDAGAAGHRTFENPTTGDRIRFDSGKQGAPGYEGVDHYHRYNPASSGRGDLYVDKLGNPCRRGCDASHLFP